MFYLHTYRCQKNWWLTTFSTSIIACHVRRGKNTGYIYIPPPMSMQISDQNMTIHTPALPLYNHKLYRHEAIINSGIIINFAKCFVITFWMYCSYLIKWFFSFKFHFKLTIGCFHTVATFRSRIVFGSQPSNLPDWLPVIKTVSFFVHSSLSFCTLP